MAAGITDFLQHHPQLDYIDLLVPDLNGILRGKRIRSTAAAKVFDEGFFLPQSLFGSDVCGDTVDATRLGIATGDRDLVCRPEPAALRLSPWADGRGAQCLFEMFEDSDQIFAASPRDCLRRIVAGLHGAGIYPVVAVELEFYLFQQGLDDRGHPRRVIDPTLGKPLQSTQVYSLDDLDLFAPFLDTVQHYCEIQRVPATTAVAEYAPGQFEINLDHGNDPLRACDDAAMLKRIIRKAAKRHQMIASFMARPLTDFTGSGTHIHVSLCDADGRNLLARDEAALHHAVAGLQASMADGMLLWAPHANSYRRYQRHAHVPLSPTWGHNNRTVALRIPAGGPQSRRIEHRVAGADASPHLVMAGVLAGIAQGIADKQRPAAAIDGDAARQVSPSLPLDWHRAIERFRDSQWAIDHLGVDLVNLLRRIKTGEYERYRRHVSELEIQWGLTTV